MSRKPEDSDFIAWFDLETTGNREDDAIVEVGFVLTDRDFRVEFADSFVVLPTNWQRLRERMAPVVVDMHTKNGLLEDIPEGWNITDVDTEIAKVLNHYGKGNHIPLAGSGVAHFDRKYIRREMVETDALLSYWAYDIGAVRRFLKWWEVPTPGSELRQAKTHRALDDIYEHIAEAKAIRDALQRLAEDSWKYWELNR